MNYATMTDEELRLNVAKRKGFDKLRTSRGRWWGEQQATGYARVYIPDWPADIAASWGLVEEMQAPPYEYYFEIAMTPAIPYKGRPCWHVEVGGLRAHAPTAPRAICIAWLEWKDAQE